MKDIINYLQQFYNKEFKWPYFLSLVIVLSLLIYLNYWHGLEENIYKSSTIVESFGGAYLLYFIPFAVAFLLQYLFLPQLNYHKSRWFWIILFVSPALFSFRMNFHLHENLIRYIWKGPDQALYMHSLNWVVRVFVLLIPVYFIWYIKDSNNQPFYGTTKSPNIKPYLYMVLIMVPLIALASTQKDFLHTYPKAQLLYNIPMPGLIDKWRYVFYELCYGFDFVSIEFFFRGFLILALVRICGMHAILPVACFYCAIHMGKPMGEAISSFFGGTLLGIVSYNTKSIWGGLIVHLGIAWLMELGGGISHMLAT